VNARGSHVLVLVLVAGIVVATALIVVFTVGGSDPRVENLTPLQQQGYAVYRDHCAACHSIDPSRHGSNGPPIAGASLDLLEARVVRGTYPPGYEPKARTKMMQTFPFLKDEIPALHAFVDRRRP